MVQVVARPHYITVTGGGGWYQPLQLFVVAILLLSFTSHLQIGFHFSQRQPDEGWRRMERAASRGL